MQSLLEDSPSTPDRTKNVLERAARSQRGILYAYNSVKQRREIGFLLKEYRNRATTEKALYEVWVQRYGDQISFATFQIALMQYALYGFVERDKGNVTLTPLGERFLSDDEQEFERAAIEGFYRVELNSVLWELYHGRSLPPFIELERKLVELGVPPKQVTKVRQTFLKSAREVGLYSPLTGVLGDAPPTPPHEEQDRFSVRDEAPSVEPSMQTAEGLPSTRDATEASVPSNIVEDSNVSVHTVDPLLVEVLQDIPKRDQPFSEEDWDDWFRLFTESFKWAKRRARQQGVLQSRHDD